MVRNYLKIAWRNFMKNKAFSFINVFGLTVGLTCCMLITLYLIHETSYDSYHKDIDRLYQIGEVFISEGIGHRYAGSPSPLAEVMRGAFPQIEATARLHRLGQEDKTLFRFTGQDGEPQSIFEDKGFLVDSGFFQLFTYQFIEGNPASAINGPYAIVLSEDIARQLYGNQPALGKVIHISSNTNGDHDYQVTGVFRPSRIPSHIDARFFLSLYGGNIGDFLKKTTNLANNNSFFTYIRLKPGASATALERQFPTFVDRYEGKDLKQAGFYKKQFLLPVRDIHLYANLEDGDDVSLCGSPTNLYILASIALFTLLIACINFMNLATARSTKRSAEVGIRKSLGAGRFSLILQFIGEAVLLAIVAFVFALGLGDALFAGFQHLAGRDIQLPATVLVKLGGCFFALALLTGVIAGSYPAFYLSSFRPIKVLKGKGTNSLAVASMRKGLVIFQFAISVILIVASVVISRQMRFLRQADLGFEKDRQLVIPLRSLASRKAFSALKSDLEKDSRILSVGGGSFYPGISDPNDDLLFAEGKTINDGYDTKLNFTDFDFLKTLNMRCVAGRLFSPRFPSDSVDGIILNETSIRHLGYALGSAVGKKVYSEFQGNVQEYRIVGVVKDFNFQDLHVPIDAFGVLVNNTFDHFNYMVVHIQSGDPAPVLKAVAGIWKKLNPNEPLDYHFLDEQFQRNYDADNRLAGIVAYFTLVAIAISCLGLFGLAAFSAEQRNKEIGIRKVLGASERSIVTLLSGDFLRLVGVALLIACPVAWYIMNRWLQDFSYKTDLSWTVFAYTALITATIAVVTISFHAIRAALANPALSLRTE